VTDLGPSATVALALVAGCALLPGRAQALEPWVVPEVARPCPQYGPGWIAVPDSRTCVRIGGTVVAEYGMSAKPARGGPHGEPASGFGTRARIRAEARTETDLGDLTLVYQTDVYGRRILGR
jgi:hypothetical protein